MGEGKIMSYRIVTSLEDFKPGARVIKYNDGLPKVELTVETVEKVGQYESGKTYVIQGTKLSDGKYHQFFWHPTCDNIVVWQDDETNVFDEPAEKCVFDEE